MQKIGLSLLSSAALLVAGLTMPITASAALIFSNSHDYAFGGDPMAINIFVEIFDNFAGDFDKYEWRYTVTNNSYEPTPGTSNGFSGFETTLPAAVPDLLDQFAPNADWEFDCCFGLPVEWDIRDSVGPGVSIGESGVFGFSSLPRQFVESTGFFHTWEFGVQTAIVNFEPGNGVEVPDVLNPPSPIIPPNAIPEPTTLVLLGLGLLGMSVSRRRAG